jgi:hypothetical protein
VVTIFDHVTMTAYHVLLAAIVAAILLSALMLIVVGFPAH